MKKKENIEVNNTIEETLPWMMFIWLIRVGVLVMLCGEFSMNLCHSFDEIASSEYCYYKNMREEKIVWLSKKERKRGKIIAYSLSHSQKHVYIYMYSFETNEYTKNFIPYTSSLTTSLLFQSHVDCREHYTSSWARYHISKWNIEVRLQVNWKSRLKNTFNVQVSKQRTQFFRCIFNGIPQMHTHI